MLLDFLQFLEDISQYLESDIWWCTHNNNGFYYVALMYSLTISASVPMSSSISSPNHLLPLISERL